MKFFNGLRRKIFGTGFGKYILYAIGEIILVVIGILLAISINDHYEKNSISKKNLENARQIYQQMASDSSEVANYLKYLSELKQTIEYLQSSREEKATMEKPLTALNKVRLFYDRDSDFINLSNLVPTQIENLDFSSTDYSQILFNIQVDYTNTLRSIRAQEDLIKGNNQRFNAYLADNYDWYTEWSSKLNCNPDCFKFISSSKKFNSMISLYSYEKSVIYASRIKDFEDKLHWNMNKLRNALKEK